jgi:hypothetical protein
MAYQLPTSQSKIRVVIREDSEIAKDLTKEEWDKYVETNDEMLLRLTGTPTRFILNMDINYKAQQQLLSNSVKVNGSEFSYDMGAILDEIRFALVGIDNPSTAENVLEFARESDGFASKELVATLHRYGIVMQLWAALTQAKKGVEAPKK